MRHTTATTTRPRDKFRRFMRTLGCARKRLGRSRKQAAVGNPCRSATSPRQTMADTTSPRLLRPAVALAVLACVFVRAVAVETYVPVGFSLPGGVPTFTLRKVDMLLRSGDPNRYPMFTDLPQTGDVQDITAAALEAHLDATTDAGGFGLTEVNDGTSIDNFQYSSPVPAGFIFHEARVGSTAAANSTFLLIYSNLAVCAIGAVRCALSCHV